MIVTFLKEDFKFSDDRGELIQLIHDGYKQVNYITAKKGSLRGGHYHLHNVEAFFVIDGEFTLEVKKRESDEKKVFKMKKGDFFSIDPNVLHSFYFTDDTQLISLYSSGVELKDGSKDIYTENQ